MKDSLEVKQVPFMGTSLMAAQDNDGQIWAGVSYICNGIGLNKNEKDRQVKNVQADRVLKKGCVKFDANNATIALKLDFVPLWLAKISITPSMESETPELAANLEQYQLRAKDVLAAAFLSKQPAQRTFRIPLSSANNTAKIIGKAMDDAGVDPRYKVLAFQDLYQSVGLKLNIPGLQAPTRYFTAEAIADKLGILSKAGLPHAKAVSAIVERLGLNENEKLLVPFEKNGHSGTSVQYVEPVIEKVRNWLVTNGYPASIQGSDGTSYKVNYREGL